MRFSKLVLAFLILYASPAYGSEKNCLTKALIRVYNSLTRHMDATAAATFEEDSDNDNDYTTQQEVVSGNANAQSGVNEVNELEQQRTRVILLAREFSRENKKLEQMEEARRSPQQIYTLSRGITVYKPRDRVTNIQAFSGTGHALDSN